MPVYQITERWPKVETYGLTSRARRSASSVTADVAEGQGSGTPKQLRHHSCIANGSLWELETHLTVAQRLGYIEHLTLDGVMKRSSEVARLLFGLMRSLR